MTRLFRCDLRDLPPHVDARSAQHDAHALACWIEADTKPPRGRWIAGLDRDGAVPRDADAVALTADAALPGWAQDLPLYVNRLHDAPATHRGPIVLRHLASYPCDADRLLGALRAMDADPRLHMETSGASIGNFIRIAVDQHPTRILFASGAPTFDADAQRLHVAAALADDGSLAAVMADNALRVLGGAP